MKVQKIGSKSAYKFVKHDIYRPVFVSRSVLVINCVVNN